jgi:glucose-6-phosphate 1-epimerase
MPLPEKTIAELNDSFGLDGVLTFDDHQGLTRLQVKTPAAEATVYLHGAHLTHWQPQGFDPVLFLSGRTELAPGKAIRGGIPVCFPWFGPRSAALGNGPAAESKAGPAHGFARTRPWDLAFAALVGDDVHLTFTLAPDESSAALGFAAFRVAYEMILGRTLTLRFTVANTGDEPFRFEEALHTYFAVRDVRQTDIDGLESAPYIDKTDALAMKQLPPGPCRLTGWSDWVFPANPAATAIHDGARTIAIAKENSNTTVVWNPWMEKSAGMADLPPDAWPHFLCVESANAGSDAVTLAPHQAHTLQTRITVDAEDSAAPAL